MKRLAIYISCTLVIALIPCVIGLYWLLNSTGGARFALSSLPALTGQEFTVRDVSGTLLGRLHLAGVRIALPQILVQIDNLDLSWQPLEVVRGDLVVDELVLAGVSIQNDAPPSALPLVWPRISGIAGQLKLRIGRLLLTNITYRNLAATPTQVTQLSASLACTNGLVAISTLSVNSPDVYLAGNITAGFVTPSLSFDLAMTPRQPLLDMDVFTLKAALLAGLAPEQLAGKIVVVGNRDGDTSMTLNGELGMLANGLRLRRLNLIRAGRSGTLGGTGSVMLTREEPIIALDLLAHELDLERDVHQPLRLSGTLQVAGTPSAFHGTFALTNNGPGWQKAALAAHYQGTPGGLSLSVLDGAILGGRLGGTLEIAWLDGVQISGALVGRGLNPAVVAADWPGNINVDVAGKLELPEHGAMRGTVSGNLLESRLHGQQLQGKLRAAFAGQRLRIDALELLGNGFKLHGTGKLDQRLEFTAEVCDLSGLVPQAAGELQLGGWLRLYNGLWSGATHVAGSNFSMADVSAETIQLDATLSEGKKYPVQLAATVEQLDMSSVHLDNAQLSFQGNLASGKTLLLSGNADAAGNVDLDGHEVRFERIASQFEANSHGLSASLDLALEDDAGKAQFSFNSPPQTNFALPRQGDMKLQWSNLDLILFKPWLPANFDLKGQLAGQTHGLLLPGNRLELDGQAAFTPGKAEWSWDISAVDVPSTPSYLTFAWRDETLSGVSSVALGKYGSAHGEVQLSLPARFPVAVDRNGTLHGTLSGTVQELGFLTTLFPDQVQDSHGQVGFNLTLGGVLDKPMLGGNIQLDKGGAYLPATGIKLADVQLAAQLTGDEININTFYAASGEGHLSGSGMVHLNGWVPAEYSGVLNGERFQTIHLPELQVSTSPQLTFAGQGDHLTVQGDLLIPELLVTGQQGRPLVTTSSDVILEGVPEAAVAGKFPVTVAGKIHLALGDKIRVKSSGIDARLGGGMELVLKDIDSISSVGEIHVVKGRYRAYGMDLDIVRGRLYYVSGSVNQPNLDILALRTVGDVRVGVTVAGTINAPVVKLYSEPPMSEVDVMSYIILGHPRDSNSEQINMAVLAANSLFTYGDSESIQEQVKDRLGLSVIGLETVSNSGSGLMGYKEMSAAPPGMESTKTTTGQSTLTVGKYLTPKLYFSYGRSLVNGGNLFLLRYDLLKFLQIETQSGSESGADLYYKLEFD